METSGSPSGSIVSTQLFVGIWVKYYSIVLLYTRIQDHGVQQTATMGNALSVLGPKLISASTNIRKIRISKLTCPGSSGYTRLGDEHLLRSRYSSYEPLLNKDTQAVSSTVGTARSRHSTPNSDY